MRRFCFFCFSCFANSLLKYKKVLSLGLETSISQNIRNFLRVDSFYFWAWKVSSWNIWKFCSLKYKKVPFPEIQQIFLGLHFQKYEKSFLPRKYEKFFNLGVKKFHFLKYKNFSYFSSLKVLGFFLRVPFAEI